MKRLVRLYPRAWRDRYGPELETLLAETSASSRAVADVVAAAGRAHGRAVHERLRNSRGRRSGNWAAVAGGGLWASTFLIGWLVDWGRYGSDLGFQLLAVLAGFLVLAQLTTAAASTGPSRPVAWLGALVALAGGLALVGAVVAAIILEPPLVIRLSLSPSGIWDRAMLLVMVGSAVSAAAVAVTSRDRAPRIASAAIIAAALVLAVALCRPLEADVLHFEVDAAGEVVFAMGFLAPVGWFVTTPLVVAAGVLFGGGWAVLGWSGLGAARPASAGAEEPAAQEPAA
jgi:hypothetical protein